MICGEGAVEGPDVKSTFEENHNLKITIEFKIHIRHEFAICESQNFQKKRRLYEEGI